MKFFAIFAAVVAVAVARPTSSLWTIPELDHALMSPNINPEVVPILADALNTIMHAIYTGGENQENVLVSLPADVPIFLEPTITSPAIVPDPVIIPYPVEAPSAASPLVQITINVNNKQVGEVAASPAVPEVQRPEPEVVEVSRPEPEVVEVPRPVPEVVEVPVQGIETGPAIIAGVNPIDIIAVNPVEVGVDPAVENEDVGPL